MHAIWCIFYIQISSPSPLPLVFVSVSKGPRGLPGPPGFHGKPGKRVRAGSLVTVLFLSLKKELTQSQNNPNDTKKHVEAGQYSLSFWWMLHKHSDNMQLNVATIALCISPQGRPGADGGRGAPGETGAKVDFIPQLFHLLSIICLMLRCDLTCTYYISYLIYKSMNVNGLTLEVLRLARYKNTTRT